MDFDDVKSSFRKMQIKFSVEDNQDGASRRILGQGPVGFLAANIYKIGPIVGVLARKRGNSEVTLESVEMLRLDGGQNAAYPAL